MLKILRAAVVPIAILFLVFGYLYLGTSSVSYKKCESYKAEYQTDASYDRSPRITRWERISLFFECEAYFSDQNGGLITAFASIVIAVFTLTLWWATAEHGRITGRVLDLARDEFNSTHRPKIIVHSVEIARDARGIDEEATIGAQIVYFNIGDTPARIVAINTKITVMQLPLRSGIATGIGVALSQPLPIPQGPVEAGPHYVAAFSDNTLEQVIFAQKSAAGRQQEAALVCIGQIVYEDARHVQRLTGFARRLDTGRAERWIALAEHPEYEYAY